MLEQGYRAQISRKLKADFEQVIVEHNIYIKLLTKLVLYTIHMFIHSFAKHYQFHHFKLDAAQITFLVD